MFEIFYILLRIHAKYVSICCYIAVSLLFDVFIIIILVLFCSMNAPSPSVRRKKLTWSDEEEEMLKVWHYGSLDIAVLFVLIRALSEQGQLSIFRTV